MIARRKNGAWSLTVTASLLVESDGQHSLTLRGFYQSDAGKQMDVVFVVPRTYESSPTDSLLVDEYQNLLRQFSIEIPDR